jgi:uncharacterized protein (DUF2164 family)
MSDLYDQVSGDQDPLTKLVGRIPGFSGYIERETRRSADKILREYMADQYSQIRIRIGNLQQDLANEGDLEYMNDLETASTKLMTFIDKAGGASYGNSGFFDAIKVNEEELSKIYAYDMSLLDRADDIARAVDNVETSIGEEGLPAAIRHLVTLTRELVIAFEGRTQVIIDQVGNE